jgi:putative SOS response-associated peptidase YedK
MCGRYALVEGKKVYLTFQQMKSMREVGSVFELLPRYNAAPMQTMPVIAVRDGALTIQPMQWWLVPHWSNDGKVNFSTFNAKAETLEQSKLFHPYFKSSRCLVPAEAFYEWKKTETTAVVRGTQRQVTAKQPMCVRMNDEQPFMFAGLFSVWKNPKTEEELPTFTIITTEPNDLMAAIHTRMPVILHEADFEQWLDRGYKETSLLKNLLVPFPAPEMKAYRVSPVVSNSRNDSPECLEPLDEKEPHSSAKRG